MRKIILLVLGIILIAGCQGYKSQDFVSSGEVKEFDVTISGYSYSPPSVKVNFGDTVMINIKNNDAVTHGITLQAFGVREFVKPGETKTIQFVANKRDNQRTFCSDAHGEELLIEVV